MASRRHFIENYAFPVVFSNLINDWPLLKWTAQDWINEFADVNCRFRCYCARSSEFNLLNGPVWENACSYREYSMADFFAWADKSYSKGEGDSAPSILDGMCFQNSGTFDTHCCWAYFDYQYIRNLSSRLLQKIIKWDSFGFPHRDGNDSTLWIGSCGSYTPCHQDTYGCNLVAQLYGNKEWILFPPDSYHQKLLKSTRIPYEESSIYSGIDFVGKNNTLASITALERYGKPLRIILKPGQVLLVPSKWWHFVRNVSDGVAISVNTWIELPSDISDRKNEAIVRHLIHGLTARWGHHDKIFNNILEPQESVENTLSTLKLAFEKEDLVVPESLAEHSQSEIKNIFNDRLAHVFNVPPGKLSLGYTKRLINESNSLKDYDNLLMKCVTDSFVINSVRNLMQNRLCSDAQFNANCMQVCLDTK